VICRGSNNYGPNHDPRKADPVKWCSTPCHGDKLGPVYGDGMQVRNWLFVEDFLSGIGHVLANGAPASLNNVGGPDECRTLTSSSGSCR